MLKYMYVVNSKMAKEKERLIQSIMGWLILKYF